MLHEDYSGREVPMLTHAQVGRRGYRVSPGGLVMEENATGMNLALGEVGTPTLHGRTSFAGVLTPDSYGTLGGTELAFGLPVETLEGIGKGVIVIHRDALTPDSNEAIWIYSHGYLGYAKRNPEPPEQPVVVADLSPVIRTQLNEIAINSRLQGRLALFKTGRSNQEPVTETTMSEVEKLVARLCSESNMVSSTVSADGMLTIAVDFPDDVRLYVEVERDGSAEAAVIKGKLDVSEIPGDAIAALTSEVILAAVANV